MEISDPDGLRPFESKGWFSPVVTEGWYLVVSKSDGWCLLVFKSEGSSPGRLIEGARRGRAGGEGLASILGQSRVYYGHLLENCFRRSNILACMITVCVKLHSYLFRLCGLGATLVSG